MATNASNDQRRTLDSEQVEDLKNARGFGVPWTRLSKYYGLPVEELRKLAGQPQFRDVDSEGGVADE